MWAAKCGMQDGGSGVGIRARVRALATSFFSVSCLFLSLPVLGWARTAFAGCFVGWRDSRPVGCAMESNGSNVLVSQNV
jgi:hypothetical protein